MSRVYLPVRAQCTQCSLPSTRNPVSSNPATGLRATCSQACSLDGGFEEFRGVCFNRVSSSATRSSARPSSARASASSARSDVTSPASTSYGGDS